MPTLMGWGVLDEIAAFPDAIKNRMKIHMLTSSVDLNDKAKASGYPILWGYIEKPLTDAKVKAMMFEQEYAHAM